MGQHKALATPGNSEPKGVHRDEPRPNPQPCSGIGQLVMQLSLRIPEQSKAKLGTTKFQQQDHWIMLVIQAMVNNNNLKINIDLPYFIPVQKANA